MGLADFLVDAGRGTPYARVGAAMGGNGGKTMQDAFIDDQLPALVDQIHKSASRPDIEKAGMALIQAGLKAGMRPEVVDHIMKMTVGPALQNVTGGELEKLRADYGAQPAVPAESRPPGTEGPLTPSGNFIDPKAATPEKPVDLNFMMKFGQATNANPEQFNKMLETPATIAGKVASNQKTQQEIDKENQAQEAIKGLPSVRPAEGQPSAQEVARINRPGITQFVDQRAKAEDPLLEERRRLIEAQAGAANAQAGAATARAGAAGREGKGSAMMQDFVRLGGNPNDQEAFLKFADTYRGKTDQTQSDQAYGSLDREIDLKSIAADAHRLGKTKPADIKALAAQRGLEVEGEPQLTVSGGAFGYGGTPSLTGQFELKKKPRVTTKSKAGATGGQGRYSDPSIDSGSAPSPQAGGRGRGQSPTSQTQGGAPQAAINYLKAHPDSAPQFKAKYGYLP